MMGSVQPPSPPSIERRGEITTAMLKDAAGRVTVVKSKTAPRWWGWVKWAVGTLAVCVSLYVALPNALEPIVRVAYEKAVANLAAPHEARAQLEHEHLQTQINDLKGADTLNNAAVVDLKAFVKKEFELATGTGVEKESQLTQLQAGQKAIQETQHDILDQIMGLKEAVTMLKGHQETMDSERHTLQKEVDRLRDRGGVKPPGWNGGTR
jgi:hypothetical protein